jgi:branched-chain amino acid transport system ATP-binding protein
VTEPALRLEALCKRFGGLVVTDDVTLDVRPGELHAIIGPNGAGKTTLINQISGLVEQDSGRIVLSGRDLAGVPVDARAALGVARTFQITSILADFSVLENVALAAQARAGSSFLFIRRVAREEALNNAAMAALTEVGLADRAAIAAGKLSHGEKRALELAIALAARPGLLLLDEPMAGAGRSETEQLVAVLKKLKGRLPMLLVEHDMDAVFALADRISVLIYGRVIASGTPAEVRADPQVIAAYLGEEVM